MTSKRQGAAAQPALCRLPLWEKSWFSAKLGKERKLLRKAEGKPQLSSLDQGVGAGLPQPTGREGAPKFCKIRISA